MGRLLPAKTALEFSVEYSSVVVFGQASLISDESSAIAALQALLDKYAKHLQPGIDYRPPVTEELKRTSVFRLKIATWSGKMKKVDRFPGAFFYEEPPTAMARRHYLENPDASGFIAGRDGYTLSTDPSRLDIDVIHTYLSKHSYWAKGRSRAVVARSIAHSLCFGIYQGKHQVGFARVITDFAVHAYLADVFVLPEYRGQGLGKWLVASMLAHPLLRGVTKWSLDTRDAQGLYEPFGFEPAAPGRHMGLRREED
jgi:GNAT superfamily N-acetyltransferase